MTHELRTPLNGIIGLQQCVIDEIGKDTEYVSEYLQPANNCAYRLLNQINNILDCCKMKFKTLKTVSEKVELKGICHDVLKLMERKARLKSLSLNLVIGDQVP